MKSIDIVDIKRQVMLDNLRFYTENGTIYLTNLINEVVKVGKINKEED